MGVGRTLLHVKKENGECVNERYARQMKKGVLEILVLKLLEQHEKYGYQLIMELKDKSGDFFSLKEGTLYPILYRLEEEGLVTSAWSVPQGKELSKKYYKISDAGQHTLRDAAALWKHFSESVNLILETEEREEGQDGDGTKEIPEGD